MIGTSHRRPPRTPLAEDGFTLIEVVVSALLVGFIAIATFNGFDVVTRATSDQRLHSQAAVLAAQSQEQLRSDSASTLSLLQIAPHTYTQTVGKETFTITQSTKWVNDNNQAVSCSATGKESNANQNGSYVEITSSVTWPQLNTKRPPVSQTSIITPPDGSGLEVDVTNGATPLQPVAGVTAIANSSELTTGEAGCVIFGAIPSTRVSVEVFKLGDVTPTGAFKKVSSEVLVAPNITTHYPVTLAQGAAVTARFTYEGLTEYAGKKVTGDTFVVFNNAPTNEKPYFEVGSTSFEYEKTGEAEGNYKALAGKYETQATTPINAEHYPTGDLFPFESSAWVVYAGDCPEDNSHTIYTEVANGSAKLAPGEDKIVSIPMSKLAASVWEGTQKETKLASKGTYKVKITNTGCSSYATPSNATRANVVHEQQIKESNLEAPFQPFGKYELCLYNETTNRSDKITYSNTNTVGSHINIYLGEGTAKEKEELRIKEEKLAREKREKEEKELREKREKEEKEKKENRKLAREKEEKLAREKREKEETEAREKRIEEEAKEVASKEDLVETGKTC